MCHDIRNSQCHRKVDSKTSTRKMSVGDFERSDHALRLGPLYLLPFLNILLSKESMERAKLARFLTKGNIGLACVCGEI